MAGLQLLLKLRGIDTVIGAFDADVNAEMKRIIPSPSYETNQTGFAENARLIQAVYRNLTLPERRSMGGMFWKIMHTRMASTISSVGVFDAELYPSEVQGRYGSAKLIGVNIARRCMVSRLKGKWQQAFCQTETHLLLMLKISRKYLN